MGTRQYLLSTTTAIDAVKPPPPPPPRADAVRHLTQEQLARRWQISPRTLERHRWLGVGIPYLKLHGRVVYRLEDVLAVGRQDPLAASFQPRRGRRQRLVPLRAGADRQGLCGPAGPARQGIHVRPCHRQPAVVPAESVAASITDRSTRATRWASSTVPSPSST